MQQTLNIDGFIQYAYSTGKYNGDQLQVIADALCALEGDMAQLSWKENGLYSHEYIYNNLAECGKKLQVYMMTGGINKSKAEETVSDFKEWMKACME